MKGTLLLFGFMAYFAAKYYGGRPYFAAKVLAVMAVDVGYLLGHVPESAIFVMFNILAGSILIMTALDMSQPEPPTKPPN